MRNLLLTIFILSVGNLHGASFLFDYTKDETAGNADWTIDDDFPYPYPSNPSNGDDWLGAISDWGFDLWQAGHEVATLPPSGRITYGDASNPLDLSNFDVFIVCEPQVPFNDYEIQAILNFVADGGGLLMVANHNASDRNNNGWDSPRIWNQFEDYFGVHFHVSGDPNNSVSIHPNTNVSTSPYDSIIHGPFGEVHAMSFYAATVVTLRTDINPTLVGHVWYDRVNGNYAMLATGRYGNGKIAVLTDSSPADDGTGRPGNNLYDGWTEPGVDNREAILNASVWLASEATNAPPSITEVAHIPAYPGPNDTVIVKAIITDAGQVISDSLFVSINGGDFQGQPHFLRVGDTSFFRIMPQPINTEVAYFVWAIDDSGATAQSDTFGYTVMESSGNPVPNGGFEEWEGGNPLYWSRDNGITWAEESGIVHSGQRSLKIINANDRKSIYSDTIPIIGGHRYNISFWVLDNVNGRARIFVRWFNESGIPDNDWSNAYSSDSPNWQRLGWEWTAPPDAQSVLVCLRFYSSNGKTIVGPFYIDEAELTDLSSNFEDDTPNGQSHIGLQSVLYTQGKLILRFENPITSPVGVKIYSANGAKLFDRRIFVHSDFATLNLALKSGIYFVVARVGTMSFVEKVLVLH